jgi:phenylpropionate dioxygenase-like ring-hydroxylating dioxygenase large terminal subunit
MSERASFLNRPYGAYHHRTVPGEDELLTHTGPTTPGGEYLRRFWHPIAHSAALQDLPVPVRVMHEDLVLFRDRSGRVGLLQKPCCHRGTSLAFGRIEERGIRCCYHGWQFDVDGRILDMPNEREKNALKDRLFQGAYPVHEYGGLVFAYMGPPEAQPPFPVYDTFEVPGYHLELSEPPGVSNVKPCNWLQVMDNVVDPVHEPFLHTTISGYQFFDRDGKPVAEMADVGELAFEETPIGILTQETRRVRDSIWVRSIECILPNIAQVARAPAFPVDFTNGVKEFRYVPLLTRWRVPIDDENTMEFAFVRMRDGQVNPYLDNKVAAYRTNYGGRSFEESQRTPGDYDAQVSQGPIARHGLEHLTSSDRGVTMFRRAVRDGIEAVRRGLDPKGIVRHPNGKIPTYANEAVIHAPRRPGANESQELKDAARRICEAVLRESVAMGPSPECT